MVQYIVLIAKNDMMIKEVNVKNILTKSNLPVSDYSVNPYIGCSHGCKYCYASFMKRFTNHLEAWGTFVDVKYWEPIKNPKKYAGKDFFIGSVTDPYMPLEKTYKRTRAFLEEMQGSGCKISIATKSDLVLRDLDLIKTFPDARVSWSINTLDEEFRKEMDHSVSITRKIEAMKKFYEAGVRTTCFISPIFPEITDVKSIILKTKDVCNLIWLENLNLRGDYKKVILQYIKEKYPKLYPLYNEIYHRGNRDYWEKLDKEIKEFCKKQNLEYVRNDDSLKRGIQEPPIVVNYFYHEEITK